MGSKLATRPAKRKMSPTGNIERIRGVEKSALWGLQRFNWGDNCCCAFLLACSVRDPAGPEPGWSVMLIPLEPIHTRPRCRMNSQLDQRVMGPRTNRATKSAWGYTLASELFIENDSRTRLLQN